MRRANDELYAFVWDRVVSEIRAAELVNDDLLRDFWWDVARFLTSLRTDLDSGGCAADPALAYLSRSAWRHRGHREFPRDAVIRASFLP